MHLSLGAGGFFNIPHLDNADRPWLPSLHSGAEHHAGAEKA